MDKVSKDQGGSSLCQNQCHQEQRKEEKNLNSNHIFSFREKHFRSKQRLKREETVKKRKREKEEMKANKKKPTHEYTPRNYCDRSHGKKKENNCNILL